MLTLCLFIPEGGNVVSLSRVTFENHLSVNLSLKEETCFLSRVVVEKDHLFTIFIIYRGRFLLVFIFVFIYAC